MRTDDPNAWLEALQNLPQPDLIYFVTGQVEAGDELDRVRRGQEQGVLALFRMIKALQHQNWWQAGLRLKVITRGGSIPMTLDQSEPYCAALSGLVGSLGASIRRSRRSTSTSARSRPRPYASVSGGHSRMNRRTGKVRRSLGERASGTNWRYGRSICHLCKPSALRRGGVYVIVGGAGGIGRSLSEHLIRKYEARIAWIGRRPLDREIEENLQADGFAGRGVDSISKRM